MQPIKVLFTFFHSVYCDSPAQEIQPRETADDVNKARLTTYKKLYK